MANSRRKGFLLVLLSAAGYGSASIFAKIAYANGASTLTVLSGRFILAAILIWADLLRRPDRGGLTRADKFRLAGAGVLYSTISLLYFSGLRLLPITVFVILSYTYPAMVTVLSFYLLREPLHRRKLISLLLTTAGCVVMFWSGEVGFHPAGIILTLGAAVAYSLFIICLSRYFGHIRPQTAMAYMTATSAVFYLIYGLIAGGYTWPANLTGYSVIAAMAVFSTAIASIAFFTGVQIIGASPAALASTVEPVFTIILATLVFREAVTPNQIAGAALVVGALLLLQAGDRPKTADTEVHQPSA